MKNLINKIKNIKYKIKFVIYKKHLISLGYSKMEASIIATSFIDFIKANKIK